MFAIESAITNVDRSIGIRMMFETAPLAPEHRLAIAILRGVFRMTVPRERQFRYDILAPEVDHGAITSDELTEVRGDHKARKAFRKPAETRADRTRNGYVLEAAADLADASANPHGTDSGRVEFARSDVARIRSGHPSAKA